MNVEIKNQVSESIESLKGAYYGLPRKLKAIYSYFSQIYTCAENLRNLGPRDVVRPYILEVAGKKLDGRVAKSLFRLLIAASSDCSSKVQSRYANALKYARNHYCPPTRLESFIGEHRGIRGCIKNGAHR
jgi:hypothetical protein